MSIKKKPTLLANSFHLFTLSKNVSTLPDLEFSPFNSIVTEDINVEGLAKLLSDLQSHKAHGPGGIPTYLLKETATLYLSLYLRSKDPPLKLLLIGW